MLKYNKILTKYMAIQSTKTLKNLKAREKIEV